MTNNFSSITTDHWIACLYPKPQASLRLFCFPSAGSGASSFQPWSKLLPPAIELCPIKLPGREDRLKEKPYQQLPALVEALAGALRPYLDKPFAFFGHSMGALISFELTRQLRRQGLSEPVQLFVSGRNAPYLPEPNPPLHGLPNAVFVERLQQRYNGIPAVILQDPDLMQLFLPILRADFAMLETYVYADEPPLDTPIAVFGGQQDSLTSKQNLAAWCDQTRSACSLRMFPGGHFFLQSDRTSLLQALTRDLTRFLDRPTGAPK